jgi:hypothetical protein
VDDDAIRALVTRLARPHASGGVVVERAAILAEGADFAAIMTWIGAHDGKPEAAVATGFSGRGLYGSRLTESAGSNAPPRFVLPASAVG